MTLNKTPMADRIHIGIFGKRNAGKSSIINALTGQNLAIVSDVKGTTTDPVLKAMELLPLGPVVLIDTPGLDDTGGLGGLRVRKAYQMLNKTDVALLVIDASVGMTQTDAQILKQIREKEIPFIVVWNKADLLPADKKSSVDSDCLQIPPNHKITAALGFPQIPADKQIFVSADKKTHIRELKDLIAKQLPDPENPRCIVGDLLHPLDLVVLVVPIDSSAPKGRLILPQQQTIRDIIEHNAAAVVVKDTELSDILQKLDKKVSMVITDSQVFGKVSAVVPPEIPLTSFSILFARYKGNLKAVVNGAQTIDTLSDGDTVLISEGCTHHRQCDDIGTVKLPKLLQSYTGKQLHFAFTSGTEFPEDLSPYRLVIHCGGCMLNEREIKYRLKCAAGQRVAMTNYGTAIAHMQGILKRSIELFQPSLF